MTYEYNDGRLVELLAGFEERLEGFDRTKTYDDVWNLYWATMKVADRYLGEFATDFREMLEDNGQGGVSADLQVATLIEEEKAHFQRALDAIRGTLWYRKREMAAKVSTEGTVDVEDIPL